MSSLPTSTTDCRIKTSDIYNRILYSSRHFAWPVGAMRVIQNGPFLFLVLFTLFSLSIAGDTLNPNQSLADNETLISSGGMFALGFFSPPNSRNRYIGIWYHEIAIQTIVWVANRETPITDSTGILSIATNGSLIIATQNSTVALSTAATGLRNPVAQLLDDGNFVVKEESTTDSDSFAWQSFDHPTDTLLPGMKLGVNLTSGLNRNLTAWKSSGDPSPGEYRSAMDISGDPEVFFWKGSQKLWRTGPWNGLEFSGIPDTVAYPGFTFSFVNNEEEVAYSYETANKSIISRLVANQSGVVQRSVWVPAAGVWNIFWYAPRDQCDPLAACGPYGVCNPNSSPKCDCLQGFTPKSPENWALRDMSGGCVRKTQLDCKNGTDGFTQLSGAKLPDTSNCSVDMSRNLDECRATCLKSCSCTAYASANISGGGSGCLMWFSELTDIRVYTDSGQDLYVRLAKADLGSTTNQSNQSRRNGGAVIAVIISLVLVVLFLTFVGFFLWRRKKRRRALFDVTSFSNRHNDERFEGDDLELPLFDLGTVAAATDGFSIANKLGEGGFGPVYKGELKDGQKIAVKRLAKTSVQGLDEFKTEVMLIAKLQHRNLVRLLGCCIQEEEKMLIYEYMANRSLDAIIFDNRKSVLLDWQTRYQIIQGIVRGLVYLHHDSRFRIIHRDLKVSNILLDKEMNPKISDFGMARIFGGDETEVNTRRVVGTYGYMSPEYAMDGIFSMKSDVFSFGVLVLEIISGKKNRGVYVHHSHLNVVGHAWSLWNEGKSLELVDESLGRSFPTNEVLKCIKVGLLCVQERPEDRPLMSSIVLMLGSDGAVLPNPKQPGFVARRVSLEVESSSSKQELSVLNDMSITALQGR